MQLVATIIVTALLSFAVLTVLANWMAVFVGYSYKRQGIDRGVSAMPVVPQIFVLLALLLAYFAHVTHIQTWVFWLIALVDTTVPMYLYVLVQLALRRLRKQT
jgi:hypothetical protein